MRVVRLRISNFRGIRNATILFDEHTVLIGPNSSGKSTIIDALSLVFGREQMVRALTEHDFHGSNPQPPDRITITATIIGFENDDPERNEFWFRPTRAVEKWWSEQNRTIAPQQSSEHTRLCAEVGWSARFDAASLTTESVRYFHDDDQLSDPFMEDSVPHVSARVLSELGYFVVPVARTRERTLSFGSEIFRRLIAQEEALPADELLRERDRLRDPEPRIEESGGLAAITARINDEFARLLPQRPRFELHVTATDSESLLQSLIPHFRYSSQISLPVHRHGTGLLSLQTMVLLLEFGRVRLQKQKNFLLAMEEPELHLPPGMQRRLVHRARGVAHQTIVASHAPGVAAYFQPTEIRVLENRKGELSAEPLLGAKLTSDAPNWMRKLFFDLRRELTEALMHDFMLVPEGRTDFECLRLLVDALEVSRESEPEEEDWDALQFGAFVGLIPTPDGRVVDTYAAISRVRTGCVALVDGDDAGDKYVEALLKLPEPPPVLLQWASGKTLEDILTWLVQALAPADFTALAARLAYPPASPGDLGTLLRVKRTDHAPGLKGDYLAYEEIAVAIRDSKTAAARATRLLAAMKAAILGEDTSMFDSDPRSTTTTRVLVATV